MIRGRVNVGGGRKSELSRFIYLNELGVFTGLDEKYNYYVKTPSANQKTFIRVDSKTGTMVSEVIDPLATTYHNTNMYNYTGFYIHSKQFDHNGLLMRDLPNQDICLVDDGVAIELSTSSSLRIMRVLDANSFIELERHEFIRNTTGNILEAIKVFPHRCVFAQIISQTSGVGVPKYMCMYNTKERTLFNSLNGLFDYALVGFVSNNYDEGVVS